MVKTLRGNEIPSLSHLGMGKLQRFQHCTVEIKTACRLIDPWKSMSLLWWFWRWGLWRWLCCPSVTADFGFLDQTPGSVVAGRAYDDHITCTSVSYGRLEFLGWHLEHKYVGVGERMCNWIWSKGKVEYQIWIKPSIVDFVATHVD